MYQNSCSKQEILQATNSVGYDLLPTTSDFHIKITYFFSVKTNNDDLNLQQYFFFELFILKQHLIFTFMAVGVVTYGMRLYAMQYKQQLSSAKQLYQFVYLTECIIQLWHQRHLLTSVLVFLLKCSMQVMYIALLFHTD